MRRADRLFRIIQYLRAGKLMTARILADKLEVSERTIYRDVADLQASGVPIDGEAGVGYLMREGYDLPPLMFNREELSALVAGARIVNAWGGARMAEAASQALAKISQVLPREARANAGAVPIYAFDFQMPELARKNLDTLHAAIEEALVLQIEYEDANAEPTARAIEPLVLYYWGKVWTLIAWCRLRNDFRMFRLDRILTMQPTGQTITPTPGRTLDDFLRSLPEGEGHALPPGLRGRVAIG